MTGLRRASRSAPKPVRRVRVAGGRSRNVAVAPEVDVAAPEVEEPPPPSRTGSPIPRWVLVAVTVVATALAVWTTVEARGIRTSGAVANTAFTDAATTQAVTSAVRTAVESAFSYDYGNVDRTRTAARQVLVGRAVQQYDELYAQVVQQAQARRLVLTTAVRSIGVTELHGDRAVVLVFVDQQVVQTGDGAHNSGATQLSVTVGRATGTWLIEDITVL